MKIFLIGFMGSGKTSIGKRLAKSLNYKFIDLDKSIENSSGQSINAIFEKFGEEHFRKLEKSALEGLQSNTETVVSAGGGTPFYKDNMDFMNNNGTTFYLEVNNDTLFHRLQESRSKRPLIKDLSDEELILFIENKIEKRTPTYLKAHHTIGADHITNAAEKIIELIQKD